MKKIIIATLFSALSGLSVGVFADVTLQSAADVQGNWKLEYTKKSVTATETLKREDSWSFNNGKVTITHIPRDGSYFDQTPVNYVVEDGKLKISLLGRPDKFDIFTLFGKDDSHLTLKGKFGDLYHFSKK